MDKKNIKLWETNIKRFIFHNKLFKKNLKKDEIKIKLLGEGTSTLNFLVEINKNKFVFRFNVNNSRLDHFKKEYKFFNLFKKNKFIPQLIYKDLSLENIFKRPFMILLYIKGISLAKTHYKISSKLIKNLAKEVSNIHLLNKNPLFLKEECVKDRIENRLIFLKKSLPVESINCLRKICSLLPVIPISIKKKLIIHNNIWEGNIIYYKGGLRIIDYETACFGEPAQEIAHIFVDFKTGYLFSKEEQNIFIKEYLKYVSDKTLLEKVNFFMKFEAFDSFLRTIEYDLASKNKLNNQILRDTMKSNSGRKKLRSYFNLLKKLEIIDKKYSLKKIYPV
ncbi:MAG: phosphotransferase [Candidatus Pacearchaeota archaeon]